MNGNTEYRDVIFRSFGAKRQMAAPPRVPLHLDPEDYSQETCAQRYDLHCKMMALNPQGWRQPCGSGSKRKNPHAGSAEPKNRMRRLAAASIGSDA